MLDIEKKILTTLDNRRLELFLFPTEQCNFRCTYCYEDFEIGRMKPDIILGIKNLIKNRAEELEYLRISWFGGEPLMAVNIVEEINSFVLELFSHKKDFIFHSDMTTNAYLLNLNTAEKIINVGVTDFQISIDGIEEIHNQTRKRADGKGTFETIWKNLLNLKSLSQNFHVMLRVHYTPKNLMKLPELIKMLNSDFSDDTRFSVIFKSVGRYGGENDENITPVSREDEIIVENNLNTKMLKANLINKDNKSSDFQICYAAKPNAYAIRANGKINKCTVALSDEKNDIGSINIDGTFELNHQKHSHWIKGVFTKDSNILECPYSEIKTTPNTV